MNNLYIKPNGARDYLKLTAAQFGPNDAVPNDVGVIFHSSWQAGRLYVKAEYVHLVQGAPNMCTLSESDTQTRGIDRSYKAEAVFDSADAALQWLRNQGIALWQPV